MSNAITIQVNGEPHQVYGDVSLSDLLDQLDLNPRTVVVELNREVVRRPALSDKHLREGDRIELVHFVGGG